jgi:tetratricopeptide (TPR) repeat protein
VFGWVNLHRARAADAEAQHARQLAEHARGDAEKLVAFLIDDFYNELAPTGRLDTLGRLAHTTVAYYDGLPKEMITPQTETFRAMALVREADALNSRGEVDTAYKLYGEAQAAFEKLRASGDRSDTVTYGLALTLFSEGANVMHGGRGTVAELQQAADLLRPLVNAAGGTRQIKQTYVDILNILSHMQPLEVGVATCQEARKVLAGIGALDLSNLNAASAYADVADSEARHLTGLGRIDEAQKLERQVYDLTEKVLAQRPGDLRSLADRFFAANLLSTLADRRHDDAVAADFADRAARAGEDYVRFNPADLGTWAWWVTGRSQVADLQFERGEIKQAVATAKGTLALADDPRRPSSLGPVMWFRPLALMQIEAQLGQKAEVEKTLQTFARYRDELVAQFAPEDPRRELFTQSDKTARSRVQLIEGDTQDAFSNASAATAAIDKVKVPQADANSKRARDNYLRATLTTAAEAAIRLGRYAEAETLTRRLQTVPDDPTSGDDPQVRAGREAAMLAHAVTMQGRGDEARTILEPALAYYGREQKAGASGTTFRRDHAYALYVSALAQPADAAGRARRSADLAEAAKVLGGASAEAMQLAEMRELAGWIATARAAPKG